MHTLMEIARAVVLDAEYAKDGLTAPRWVQDIIDEGEKHLTPREGMLIAERIDAGLVRL